MNVLDGQLDTIDNRLLKHPTYRERLLYYKKEFRKSTRGLTELLDDLADNGID